MTLSHILTLGAFEESFSDPKLAKRLPGCLLTPYLPPVNPIKKLREQNVLIGGQQVPSKNEALFPGRGGGLRFGLLFGDEHILSAQIFYWINWRQTGCQ